MKQDKASKAIAKMRIARATAVARKENEEMCARYPHLTPIVKNDGGFSTEWLENDTHNLHTLTNNIKAELKKQFPTIKFSVQRNTFSGGFSYSVTWTSSARDLDEELEEELKVKDVLRKFRRTLEDRVDDCYITHDTDFTKVFGGCDYLINCYCRTSK